MKLQILAACAALATVSAGAAFAGDTITAKLQQPVAEKTKVIAGGAMFVCQADACVATAPTSQTFATSSCKTLAAKLGPVEAFGGRKSLDDGRLADCNAEALARVGAGPLLAKQ